MSCKYTEIAKLIEIYGKSPGDIQQLTEDAGHKISHQTAIDLLGNMKVKFNAKKHECTMEDNSNKMENMIIYALSKKLAEDEEFQNNYPTKYNKMKAEVDKYNGYTVGGKSKKRRQTKSKKSKKAKKVKRKTSRRLKKSKK